jgi:membrane peptidoglycan carboxypeptidase
LASALPGRVADAVLAVEDHRFYRHRGIDPLALPRSAGGVVSGHDAGGATIEVQLAKWLYTGGQRDHLDQAEQVVLAAKLDLRWGKQQLLLMHRLAAVGTITPAELATAKGSDLELTRSP